MTVKNIIDKANVLSDEQVADTDVIMMVNSSINKINLELTTFFPNYTTEESADEVIFINIPEAVDPENPTAIESTRIKQMTSINNTLLEQIVRFTIYWIKVQDTSQFEYVDQLNGALTDIRQFLATYKQFIKQEYKELMNTNGDYEETPVGVYAINEENPYDALNTWSQDPGSGNSTASGYATTDDPYGNGE